MTDRRRYWHADCNS